MAAFNLHSANLVGAGEPLRLDGRCGERRTVPLLGVPPLRRPLDRAGGRPRGAAATVVISERCGVRVSPPIQRAIGSTVLLNDSPASSSA